ncbi:hypothetical protein OEZ85_000546 [Tetradesmus obliquus]|uniref:Uncharacterized protein n=1 Tax=Tetradesmus obliquus TaxID=3088 RepID=A0ABY8UM37_TETOB|nr:hypothetical protein OEZ85_000546 [Tetradesmus obliquus]
MSKWGNELKQQVLPVLVQAAAPAAVAAAAAAADEAEEAAQQACEDEALLIARLSQDLATASTLPAHDCFGGMVVTIMVHIHVFMIGFTASLDYIYSAKE